MFSPSAKNEEKLLDMLYGKIPDIGYIASALEVTTIALLLSLLRSLFNSALHRYTGCRALTVTIS